MSVRLEMLNLLSCTMDINFVLGLVQKIGNSVPAIC